MRALASALFGALLLASSAASAGVFEFTYVGTINATNAPGYLPLNDTVTIKYRYDTNVAYGLQAFNQAFYSNAVTDLSVSFGYSGYNGSVTGHFGQMSVYNNIGGTDGFSVYFARQAGYYQYQAANTVNLPLLAPTPEHVIFGGNYVEELRINLATFNTNMFNTSYLLPTTINLADWTAGNNFGLGFKSENYTYGPGFSAGGGFTSVTVQEIVPGGNNGPQGVPAPGALALVGLGLLGLGAFRRKAA